jgi:hypothetical protein
MGRLAIISVRYAFRQPLKVPAPKAFDWCVDFGPADGRLFGERTRRTVEWINRDAVILTDLTYPRGERRRIRRLVRIDRCTLSWTNTHLDGPFRHSQFWYRIVPDGPSRCHLEFTGLKLEKAARAPSPSVIAARSERERRLDSGVWSRFFAPALEAECAGSGSGPGGHP